MQLNNSLAVADRAVSSSPDRAATSLLYDSDDARVVIFRIGAGQTVPLHSSTSSVILTVIHGSGYISGPVNGTPAEHAVGTGAIATYQPGELHGMRADTDTMIVIATIAPRPGAR